MFTATTGPDKDGLKVYFRTERRFASPPPREKNRLRIHRPEPLRYDLVFMAAPGVLFGINKPG